MPDAPTGATVELITYADGIDTAEEWSHFWEGRDHACPISVIHLSTIDLATDDAPCPATLVVFVK